MKEKAFIGLFTNLFEYPTTTLLDKTVNCQNILEKESPESAKQLEYFLNYLFDTPFYELELAFTRSPHRYINAKLRQCYDKYQFGMINTTRVGLSEDNKDQLSKDLYLFIKCLPSLTSNDEINYVVTNFVIPTLEIVTDHFNKTILLNSGKDQRNTTDNEDLFMYKHAFNALSIALHEETDFIDVEESILKTLSINPLIATHNQQVAASLPFMSAN